MYNKNRRNKNEQRNGIVAKFENLAMSIVIKMQQFVSMLMVWSIYSTIDAFDNRLQHYNLYEYGYLLQAL